MELLLTMHDQQILVGTAHPEITPLVLSMLIAPVVSNLTFDSLRVMIDEIGIGSAAAKGDAPGLQDLEVHGHPGARVR
jgi:hypothetical protein